MENDINKTEVVEEVAIDTAEDRKETGSVSEPVETMEDYARELEASFKKVAEGDMLTGTVIGVTDTEVILDLKYYAEGKISKENLSNDPEFNLQTEVSIGDEITATVIKTDDGQGSILLSKKEANDILAWERLEKLMEDRTLIPAKVGGIVNSGVIAYVEGIRGFIPASKLDLGYVEDLNEWLGKTLELTVITVDKSKNKLVLSAREAALMKASEEKNKEIAKCEVGSVMEGTIDTIKDYGAFVRLDNGLSGLLHISQISDKRIKTPAAVLKTGERVKVKVISIANNKLSLSIKALKSNDEFQTEEVFDYKESGSAFTSLGSLLSGIKIDK